jgi:hypothetical protein
MAALCAEFGISRKTGYKIYDRYQAVGLHGLTDRSRRPHRHAHQLPTAVEKLIVRLKQEDPKWGAPKLQERLRARWPEVACPAVSTVHAVLDRHGLVRRRRRRVRPRLTGTRLTHPSTPMPSTACHRSGKGPRPDFRDHLGHPIPSPALFKPMHDRFVNRPIAHPARRRSTRGCH